MKTRIILSANKEVATRIVKFKPELKRFCCWDYLYMTFLEYRFNLSNYWKSTIGFVCKIHYSLYLFYLNILSVFLSTFMSRNNCKACLLILGRHYLNLTWIGILKFGPRPPVFWWARYIYNIHNERSCTYNWYNFLNVCRQDNFDITLNEKR